MGIDPKVSTNWVAEAIIMRSIPFSIVFEHSVLNVKAVVAAFNRDCRTSPINR